MKHSIPAFLIFSLYNTFPTVSFSSDFLTIFAELHINVLTASVCWKHFALPFIEKFNCLRSQILRTQSHN